MSKQLPFTAQRAVTVCLPFTLNTEEGVCLKSYTAYVAVSQNSFIPPFAIRQIRDLMRYRVKLTHFASSGRSRIQNSLTVSNIMLSSVVSDTFGKSSMKIINHILEHPDSVDFDVTPMLHRSMQSKAEDVKHSIEGTLSKPQADKMTACFSHLDNIKQLKSDIEKAVIPLAVPFNSQIDYCHYLELGTCLHPLLF